ncbi:hypothetical protein BO82DRAFT_82348 [Aspergillus uvarum CBS 121591]|uniref:Uncharacterized protein n=1 Tax=Aspergillus uvarum CBS 121591 TaxID=1448315 RepID=A0A319C8N5_9EURO|nr:hypothetical protein BO82DRAFT_82348 [Aspergillus uvarum CBS 121591]PYH81604.1 hypothetical protein BO82DRAFT_82348 [Aspergillus uvarum CBS 121591]
MHNTPMIRQGSTVPILRTKYALTHALQFQDRKKRDYLSASCPRTFWIMIYPLLKDFRFLHPRTNPNSHNLTESPLNCSGIARHQCKESGHLCICRMQQFLSPIPPPPFSHPACPKIGSIAYSVGTVPSSASSFLFRIGPGKDDRIREDE